MRALVAGGAGFIGSHLVDGLLQEGYEVVCVDDFSNGTRMNIRHLVGDSNFLLIQQDITDYLAMEEVFRKHRIDCVYHLAANSNIQASVGNPVVEYRNTYTTTFVLLECMRKFGVKKLFFSSTSAVYGDVCGALVNENYAPMQPISYYGACKLGSENLISAYSYMNDLQSLVFRFPNVVGPRLTHGVIYDFIKKLRKNPTRLQILGNGKQSKPYIHVRDLITCILRMKNNLPDGVSVYNVGDDSQTSVTRIADIVCDKMGLHQVNYEFTGGEGGWKGDVPKFAYDLTRIHNTGWSASMTSDEAVSRTVEEVL